ncbi:hypothetical protein FOA43_003056 [Brettanomyces nanus]|uniref:Small ribosomal subunit protein mS41 n=1 Tax=Eeniella nana TaxID=13502 RepID=A0A875RVN8_EENNA|nr:uncharacterized protein FOA43_003056 [Brettanomyces nanus]QPG75697.1 hypothetical protein FOA43_003056 [Brettanomyces nanus]
MSTINLVLVPEPTKEVPDVDTFLNKIGHQASEASSTFENDWKKFFTMTSKQMKEGGIDTSVRRYILDWQEKYKKSIPLQELRTTQRKHGGERKSRIYAADKKVKDRIKMAQLKKAYRKKSVQEVIQTRRWEKLHREQE